MLPIKIVLQLNLQVPVFVYFLQNIFHNKELFLEINLNICGEEKSKKKEVNY